MPRVGRGVAVGITANTRDFDIGVSNAVKLFNRLDAASNEAAAAVTSQGDRASHAFQRLGNAAQPAVRATQELARAQGRAAASAQQKEAATAAVRKELSGFHRVAARAAQAVTGIEDAQKAVTVASRRMEKSFERVQRRARFMRRRIISLRGAIGALAGTGAIGLAVRRSTAFGAALVEQSRVVGLTVERLQEYNRFFAEDGANATQSTTALLKFNRALNDASRAGSPAAEAFNALGVSVVDFAGNLRTADDVLQDVIAVVTPENIGRLLRPLQTLFEEEGIRALGPALTRTTREFEGAVRRAQSFGIVTRAQAENLKDLDQAFADVTERIRNMGAALVAGNAAALERLLGNVGGAIGTVVRNADNATRAIQSMAQATFLIGGGIVTANLTELAVELAAVAVNADRAKLSARALGALRLLKFSGIFTGVAVAVEGVRGALTAPKSLEDELKAVNEQIARVKTEAVESFGTLREELSLTARIGQRSVGFATGVGNAMRRVVNIIPGINVPLIDAEKSILRLALEGEEWAREIINLRAELGRAAGDVGKILEDTKRQPEAVRAVAVNWAEVAQRVRDARGATFRMVPSVRQIARDLDEAFTRHLPAREPELIRNVEPLVKRTAAVVTKETARATAAFESLEQGVGQSVQRLVDHIARGVKDARALLADLVLTFARAATQFGAQELFRLIPFPQPGAAAAAGGAAASASGSAGYDAGTAGRARRPISVQVNQTITALDSRGVDEAAGRAETRLRSVIRQVLNEEARRDGTFRSTLRTL